MNACTYTNVVFFFGSSSLMSGNIEFHKTSLTNMTRAVNTSCVLLLRKPHHRRNSQIFSKDLIVWRKKLSDGMCNLFEAAYYIAYHKKPFTDFPGLVALFCRTGSEVPSCYSSDKGCACFIVEIYDFISEPVLEKIRSSRLLSLSIDGATDSATMENELIYVTYLNDSGHPSCTFLSIEAVKHANAVGVLEAVESGFEAAGMHDWQQKLVGF